MPRHHKHRPLHRPLFLALGLLFVAIGAVGVVLPVLPTTPFLLLAAWAFGRSSQRLADWLENHPRFGPTLRNWRAYRVIPAGAKVMSLSMMSLASFHLAFFAEVPTWAFVAALLTMVAGAAFVLSCPSSPQSAKRAKAARTVSEGSSGSAPER